MVKVEIKLKGREMNIKEMVDVVVMVIRRKN